MTTLRSKKRSKFSPEDRLWLEILERHELMKMLSPERTRWILRKGGFPEKLIDAYILNRDACSTQAHD